MQAVEEESLALGSSLTKKVCIQDEERDDDLSLLERQMQSLIIMQTQITPQPPNGNRHVFIVADTPLFNPNLRIAIIYS